MASNKKSLLTQEILQRRGFQYSLTCFLFQQEAETNGHSFLNLA